MLVVAWAELCVGGRLSTLRGAIVGLAETAVVVATTAPAEEYWLLPYAVVSYGLLGALLGLAYAVAVVAANVVSIGTDRNPFGGAAAWSLFLLGCAVMRYHVIQRMFHEELVMFSISGLITHLAIIVTVGGLALLVRRGGTILLRHRRGLLTAAAGLVLCLVISSGAAVLASPGASEPPVRRGGRLASGRPNIVLIIADTLRADALSCYGAPAGSTPALDRFAADAVRFENAFSQSTWTRPSIATILTSLYPSVHGAVHKMDALSDRVTTVAEALRANGYWTAGVVSNINVAPVFNFNQGFDEYTYLAPAFYFWATDSATQLAIYKGLRVLHERLFREYIYYYHYYQDAQIVDETVTKWLAHAPPQPFFLLIHYMDPHDPYFEIPYNGRGVARVTTPNPPPAQRDRLHQLYAEDASYLDGYLDTLFSRFKSLGLYDDSVIAVTADHGEEFQDHGGWWHGTSLYQEQVHVPLIVKRAHEERGGTVESGIARSLDIAPTLMAAAGLPAPAEFSGHDLFASPPANTPPLFAEEDLEGNVLASLRIGSWKIITANASNPRGLNPVELYDLSLDPGERQDLAAAEPGRTQQMLRALAEERERILAQARRESRS
jgi:arylsulfatase A-like enzyme